MMRLQESTGSGLDWITISEGDALESAANIRWKSKVATYPSQTCYAANAFRPNNRLEPLRIYASQPGTVTLRVSILWKPAMLERGISNDIAAGDAAGQQTRGG